MLRINKNIMTKQDKKAKAAHDIWAHWMKYMFERLGKWEDEVVIDSESVKQWERLMNTPFEELTEEEKESDYEVAKLFLGDI